MNLSAIITAEDFQKWFRNDVWTGAARSICQRHKLAFENLKRSEHGENVVFLVDARYVVKIYTPFRSGFERERAALRFAENKTTLPLPEIIFEGEIENFKYLVLTQKEGVLMQRAMWLNLEKDEQISVVSELAAGLKELHTHNPRAINFDWQKFVTHQAETVFERQKSNGASVEWLEKLPLYLEENIKLLPENGAPAFLHGDVHFGNLRLKQVGGKWRISALFDFADSLKGFHEYEFVAVGVLMIQGQREIQREMLLAYGYRENELDEILRRRLMLLTILYEQSDLRKYALRLRPEAIDYTLEELEKSIWAF
ncbi:MAG TPA: phosphotransferase [Pyrinomonadaceae bacterium]|jgi:hygromycin-B 7''-O-kinase